MSEKLTVKLSDLKPAVLDTFLAIASGEMIISLNLKLRCGELEEYKGRQFRDPEFPDRKLLVSGAVTLYEAGFLTKFGTVSPAGRQALEKSGGER